MASSVTLLQLRTQVRALADSGGAFEADTDRYIDDSELNDHINASGKLWYGMVLQAIPEMYEATQTISVPTDAVPATLPSDHYKTLGVRYQDSSGETYQLHRVQYQQRTRYNESNQTTRSVGYYLKGTTLVLVPDPSAGTYLHDYVTAWTTLSADGDSFDGFSGWEQWIVYDVVVKARMKEKSDATQIVRDREAIKAEIMAMAADRELMNTYTVQDVRTREYDYYHLDPDFWTHR